MLEKPLSIMKRMLATRPETDHEFTYAASEGFDGDIEVRELAQIEARYTVKYREVTRDFIAHLGNPIFEGDVGDEGYPGWYSSLRLSVWRQDKHHIYTALRHDAQDLPFVVVYGITGLNSDLLSEGSTVHLTGSDS